MSDLPMGRPCPEGLTQSQRDRAEAGRRVQDCGPFFALMEERLRPFPKGILLSAARSMCQARGIAKPDRICVRGRTCLICFFCTHFPDFPAGFPVMRHAHSLAVQARCQPPPAPAPKVGQTAATPHDLLGALTPESDEAITAESFWDPNAGFTNFFQ
jgi:hypothetical protein